MLIGRSESEPEPIEQIVQRLKEMFHQWNRMFNPPLSPPELSFLFIERASFCHANPIGTSIALWCGTEIRNGFFPKFEN
jgi:hypothetical protein